MTGSKVLNRFVNKVVRQLSGLGRLPDAVAAPVDDAAAITADVVVIGGGPAGLAAATSAAESGAVVVLVDEQLQLGGSLRYDPRFGVAEADRRAAQATAIGVQVLGGHTLVGWFPEQNAAVAVTATTLVRLAARAWIWATGSYAVNLPVPDNDRPGVFAARAVGRLLVEHAILAGDRMCILEEPGAEDYASALSAALTAAGATAIRIAAHEVAGIRGRSWVKAVAVGKKPKPIACDAVAVAAVPSPASEGPRQHGCEVVLDPTRGGFIVVADAEGATHVAGVFACGDVCGYGGPAAAESAGNRCGAAAAAFASRP
jgi:sarcosine oxidase subunit alpha